MKKAFLPLLILAAMNLLATFNLSGFFALDLLKQTQGSLASWRSNAPSLAAAGYFGLYVAMAALSLPGTAIMSLARADYPKLAVVVVGGALARVNAHIIR